MSASTSTPPRPPFLFTQSRATAPTISSPSSSSRPPAMAALASPSTTTKTNMLNKLRPWKLSVAGRRKSKALLRAEGVTALEPAGSSPGNPYNDLVTRRSHEEYHGETEDPNPFSDGNHIEQEDRDEGDEEAERYDWEAETVGEDEDVDVYSWVDPSIAGTEAFRRTPTPEDTGPTGPMALLGSQAPMQPPEPPPSNRPTLTEHESYNLLLAYQSTTSASAHSSASSSARHASTSEASHVRNAVHPPEWYEMVDRSILESLGRQEVKRQGVWWELINGEKDYVRDLQILCEDFIEPLRNTREPLIQPSTRLEAFINEVFSTTQVMYENHARLLNRLMERQRVEWPLLTSATDLLLTAFLEMGVIYDQYMKNYPFSISRIRRERERNDGFNQFLVDRHTAELTQRRDVYALLSRPMTRLPRIILQLNALLDLTPPDHPDQESIQLVAECLERIVKGSQPGIESAEAKIKLWNAAENLLFKKGEVLELDISSDRRTLVHQGFVFRRIKKDSNWHGWQDLRAILLDNYFLLTRDEEQGRHVVVSRPIHIDFLHLISADGVPERRQDYVSNRRRLPGAGPIIDHAPDRLMFPFTISTSAGPGGRTYTLCTGSHHDRSVWKERIEGARILRKFDSETNRMFAVHTISHTFQAREPIVAASTFSWRNRDTVALGVGRSVWIGWRHDAHSFRELIRLPGGVISCIASIPDFGWLLVVQGGSLLAFNLQKMMPTSTPETWTLQGKLQAVTLSTPEHAVAFVRVGVTKDRTMITYAAHSRTSHQTTLSFHEPLVEYDSSPFRHFASSIIPGFATDLSFFRQTVSVVTEKAFIIAEPGNPTSNSLPSFPPNLQGGMVHRLVMAGKPMMMYQVAENEFLLVYNWGGCYVTKFGEIARNGSYLRWNLTPSYSILRAPHLLLFDEAGGTVEVRNITTGIVVETVEEKGLKPIPLTKSDGEVLALSTRGLLNLVETVPL